MAQTQRSQSETPQSPSPEAAVPIPPTTPRPPAKVSRKRTKTGCLTCRKRRIKCGEERPICSNCTKSKRNCEGYNQRVVFKHPAGGSYLAGHASASGGPVPLAPSLAPGYLPAASLPGKVDTHVLPHVDAQRQYYEATFGTPVGMHHPASRYEPTALHGNYYHQPGFSAHPIPPAVSGMWATPSSPAYSLDPNTKNYSHLPWQGPQSAIHESFGAPFSQQSYSSGHATTASPFYNAHMSEFDASLQYVQKSSYSTFQEDLGTLPTSYHLSSQSVYPPHSVLRQQSSSSDDWQHISPVTSASIEQQTHQDPSVHMTSGAQTEPQVQAPTIQDYDRRRYSVHGFVQRASFDMTIPSSVQPPAVLDNTLDHQDNEEEEDEEEDENDPWDVEMELAESNAQISNETEKDLSIMLSRHVTQDMSRMRTFKTFLDSSNILATYRPSHSASPLTDENTAKIFCHFVAVTGPCISIFERQPSNTSLLFSNSPIAPSQKALWTYTLPSMALTHPPLMHAMLALSALHIAKLQQTSDAPSIKHFTYALRRISKLIGLPKRRNEIPTLAANLLIGFYEILLADHSKWNIHLNGAKILVMEIDFANTLRRLRKMRAEAKNRIAQTPAFSYEEYKKIAGIPEALLPNKDWEVDEDLVSQLTGFHIQYDNQWQANSRTSASTHDLTAKEVEDYKVQSDLYWWYCKQDIFSSMVSGNRLLMPYERWIYCPPRGQIGKLESTYATMDHLCLIMARITDFGGKDLSRKRRVMAAQGGQWKPPPGFFGPSGPAGGPPQRKAAPDQSRATRDTTQSATDQKTDHQRSGPADTPASDGPPRTAANAQPPAGPGMGGGPPMYGMMPPPSNPVQMHSAFQSMTANLHEGYDSQPKPLPQQNVPMQDLSEATSAALAEHAEIAYAFDLFAQSLGPGYKPLPPDAAPPISTPFGPAVQYRTYPIACIWAFYHVGRILLHRLHPHMPPAAMVSAGVTAHLTHNHAQMVGKICAGLYTAQQWGLQTGNLNPSLGSALMESTFSLFFAAVQFQDAGQRGWTISKLNDIARLTGWQTSAAVAAGCEVCWEKMGQAGRGPPYTPTMDRRHRDDRVSGRGRRTMDADHAREGAKAATSDGWGGAGIAGASRRGEKVRDSGSAATGREDDSDEDKPHSLIDHDRRLINTNANARVHWALGILGVEDDMQRLDLDKA